MSHLFFMRRRRTARRIAFLFGAGVSIPAGMPSTRDITEYVLRKKPPAQQPVYRFTDECWYPHSPPTPLDCSRTNEYLPPVLTFLSLIWTEIERFLKREPNYEDLYYLCDQLADCLVEEFENPGLLPLIEKLCIDDGLRWLRCPQGAFKLGWNFEELVQEARNYIHDIVSGLLKRKPQSLTHLQFIQEAYEDKDIAHIDVITTNHDNVLENFLSCARIAFSDGFGKQVNGVRWWNPDLFETEGHRLRLLKVHGSIDWFSFIDEQTNRYIGVGRPCAADIYHLRSPEGRRMLPDPNSNRPLILIGIFNKILKYSHTFYFKLHQEFYQWLRKADRLAVAGYSFGDKAINIRLVEWVTEKPHRRIVVIHPDPGRLKQNARGLIQGGRPYLSFIESKIEDVSWEELRCQLLG